MSRTNPYKKRRRSAHKTRLIYCEGLEDFVVIKYLRGLYSQDSGISCKVLRGKGGSADGIVAQASSVQGAYDDRRVVLDNDKPKAEMTKARQIARQKGIKIIELRPCIEALLLSILEPRKKIHAKSSSWCKKEFESRYISDRQRSNIKRLESLLPKYLLDTRREGNEALNKIIKLFERI